MSTVDTQQWVEISSMNNRIYELERNVASLQSLIVSEGKNWRAETEQIYHDNQLQWAEINKLWQTVSGGGTGEVTRAQFTALRTELEQAFLKVQRADIFLTGTVLDLARYTQTPIEPIVEKALGEIGARGLTLSTLEEYTATPQLTAAPYTQAPQDNALGDFWQSLTAGFGGFGIGAVVVLGLGAVLLLGGRK